MAEPQSLSCAEYKFLRQSGEEYTLIDVREKDEWESGHLEEAIHIPLGDLEEEVDSYVDDNDDKVVVCCARGGRGKQAAEKLIAMGYTDVSNLEGGYLGYCEEVDDDGSLMEMNEQGEMTETDFES